MTHISKRFKKIKDEGFDAYKLYSADEAVSLVKKLVPTKFDASVEVHIHLGIDPKKGDQSVRGNAILPHGTGKSKKIIAFVSPEKEKEAKEAGADIVADDETINAIKTTQKVDADIAVATPDMMRKLAPIAKVLGQKGMMPNPKTDTVNPNIAKVIKDIKSGSKISFKADDTANLHQIIGKVSFDEAKLKENFETFMDVVKKAKPDTMKGTYLRSVTMCSSMGPGIKVAV